jgi:excisionase family DNA binding protein
MSSEPLTFKHDEAAEMLGMHPATLHRLRKRGLVSYRKSGRWVRYTRTDLEEYLESVKQPATKGVVKG